MVESGREFADKVCVCVEGGGGLAVTVVAWIAQSLGRVSVKLVEKSGVVKVVEQGEGIV